MSKSKSKSKVDSFTKKRIEIGGRIRQAREYNKYTQQKVADELSKKLVANGSTKDCIAAQSISYWENGTFLPSTENLILLSEVLGVSVSSLVESREPFKNAPQKQFYDIDRTYKRVQDEAKNRKLTNSIKALPYVKKAFSGYFLKSSDIPFILHPLNMVCHLFAMDIYDDDIIAATLLHDVMEDCCVVDDDIIPRCVADTKGLDYRDVKKSDLPVDIKVQDLVSILTRPDGCKDDPKKQHTYFTKIASDPKAALIKLVDRANNISKMSWGLSHDKIHRMVDETEEYVLSLLRTLKDSKNAKFDNAQYLLSYQIQTTLDIYKRLM